MRFTTPDGKEWRYVGQGYAQGPCYTMTPDGIIMVAAGVATDGPIVAAVRREYTFGGVVFEETGEERKAKESEWWLNDQGNTVYIGGCCRARTDAQ